MLGWLASSPEKAQVVWWIPTRTATKQSLAQPNVEALFFDGDEREGGPQSWLLGCYAWLLVRLGRFFSTNFPGKVTS